MGDPILHIELRRWADIVLVAPCSANTLAKISNGICDNLAVSTSGSLFHLSPSKCPPFLAVDISTEGVDANDAHICLSCNEYFHVRTPTDS